METETDPVCSVHRTQEEGELSEHDKDSVAVDQDLMPSEELAYWKTVRCLSHIPDFNSAASLADDNPFAAPKPQSTRKLSVDLPTSDCLCKKYD